MNRGVISGHFISLSNIEYDNIQYAAERTKSGND